jgi:hypothetical protein
MLRRTNLIQVTFVVIIYINKGIWCGANQFGLCAFPRVIPCSLMLIAH